MEAKKSISSYVKAYHNLVEEFRFFEENNHMIEGSDYGRYNFVVKLLVKYDRFEAKLKLQSEKN